QLQQIYYQELQRTTLSLPNIIEGHTWQTYMVILPKSMNQAETILKLKKADIEANLGAQAIHCQMYYQKKYPKDAARLAGNNAECLFRQGLALPLYPGLKTSRISLVSQSLKHISTDAFPLNS
ncbi:MAG: DegT/DnrJ/EryC1/StrS family aminotransferase, partial [Thermodesulfobacteriota bacterium]